jgi:hypothetical protein
MQWLMPGAYKMKLFNYVLIAIFLAISVRIASAGEFGTPDSRMRAPGFSVAGTCLSKSGKTVSLNTPAAVSCGGTGTASTLTGIVRGGSPMTGSELSGDVTTSGSNAATVVKVNGAAVPTSAGLLGSNGSNQLTAPTNVSLAEGSAPSGVASSDILYPDSGTHRWKMINNNGTAAQVVQSGVDINTSDQVSNGSHITNASIPVSGLVSYAQAAFAANVMANYGGL